MSAITTHVLDTSRGKPAAGVGIVLEVLGAELEWTRVGKGATDADGLTKPKAFVALRNPPTDPAAMAAELCDFLRERLPAYKVPRWLIPVERLPRTATGKIQRFKL